MAQHNWYASLGVHVTCHLDEIPHEVVCRDVVGEDGAVVVGSPPVFASSYFDVALLIGLDDGER